MDLFIDSSARHCFSMNDQLELRQVDHDDDDYEASRRSMNDRLIDFGCAQRTARQQQASKKQQPYDETTNKMMNKQFNRSNQNQFPRSRKSKQQQQQQTSKAFKWQLDEDAAYSSSLSLIVLNKSFRLQRRTSIRSCLMLISLVFCCCLFSQQSYPQINCQSVDESATTAAATTTTSTQQPPTTTSASLEHLDAQPVISGGSGGGGDDNTTTTSNVNGLNVVVNKLKPVNFTLVDEIFESTLRDDEVVKRWKNMDAQFQDGIRSILKLVFPQIVAISQDAKVSGDCSGGILKWILSLRNLRSWAIKMLDATGKPTAGIFEGSLTMFGNYRQCLSIRAPDEDEIEITDQFEEYFRGQFCVIHLKPWMPTKKPFYHLNSTIESLLRKNYKYYEKTLYDELAEIAIAFNFIDIRMDLCVPSTCTMADIQRVAELLSRKLEMRAKVMRCDTSPRESATSSMFPNQYDRFITTCWLMLPAFLIGLVLLCTLLNAFGRRPRRTIDSDDSRKSTGLIKYLSLPQLVKLRLIMPKSDETVILTGGAVASDEQKQQPLVGLLWAQRKPLPLYGLRNIFIFWFIIVQMTVELKYQYLRESLVLRNMLLNYWPFQIIINSTLLFDSIILMTAFAYSYSNLESTFKELVGYIVDKYLRLIPAIVTIISLTIFTPLFGIESPVWKNFVEQQAEICKSTGYLNLFFLQNFISYEKICIPHTWLFCVEFQLVLISIPLIILLKKIFIHNEDSLIIEQSEKLNEIKSSPGSGDRSASDLFKSTLFKLIKSKAGLIGLFMITLGFLINFFLVYLNQLPPSWFFTFPDVDQKNYYFGKYLSKTWTHLTPFFIGLFAGHLCRSTFQLNNLRLMRNRTTVPSVQQQDSASSDSLSGGYQSTTNSNQSIVSLAPIRQSSDLDSSSDGGRRNGKIGEKSTFSFSLQLSAIVCMLAIIFSTYSWSTNESPSALVAALYDSLSRLVWSLGLVLIIIQLCLPNGATNKYTQMGQFFSHRAFIILGRLSFLVYLITPYVHTFVLAVEEQSMFPSLFLIFHVIVGNIVITYLVAFIISILIEQPIRLLFQRLIGQTARSSASFCMPQQTATIHRTPNKQQKNETCMNHGGQEESRTDDYFVNSNNGAQNGLANESAAHQTTSNKCMGLPTIVATSH